MEYVRKDPVDQLEHLSGVHSDTYVSLLRKCRSLEQGRTIHLDIARSGRDRHTFLGNLLVGMYGRCRSVLEARGVFEGIEKKNSFSWNILLSAYAANGHLLGAREVFDAMPVRDVVSWNTMFGAYVQHSCVQDAKRFFDKAPVQNVVSWNAMITAYATHGYPEGAVRLFHQMQLDGFKPDEVTFTVVLDSWSAAPISNLQEVERIIVEAGFLSVVKVGNALINLFGRLKRLDKVELLFANMACKDVVTWTTRIAAFARNGKPELALKLFACMVLEGLSPDKITFITLNEACGDLQDLKQARMIHIAAIESGVQLDTKVANSLVSMYGKCGDLTSASDSFENLRLKDVISWTAMVTACAQNGNPQLALKTFSQMDLEGFGSDKVACLCLIDACTTSRSLPKARLIHSQISCARTLDAELQNAILNMYSKCGSLREGSSKLNLSHLDTVGWNTVITAFAQNAEYLRAIECFRTMTLDGGSSPDSVTFIAVLNACSHSGSLKQCCTHFVSMVEDFRVEPAIEHFVCLADALGRGGLVQNAEELLSMMPVKPNEIAWRSLLGSCGINGDLGRGKLAAENILSNTKVLNPKPHQSPNVYGQD